MNKKTNKILISLAIIFVAVLAFFAIDKFLGGDEVTGDKQVLITIIDESNNKTLLEDEKFSTDAITLEEFLNENKEELKVEIENSEYGAFLNGIYGIKTEDMTNGPWWMYGYSSSDQGINYEVGQAPGISDINLGKENSIIFKFTSDTGN